MRSTKEASLVCIHSIGLEVLLAKTVIVVLVGSGRKRKDRGRPSRMERNNLRGP
jgi:hypothetical protein